MTNSRRSKQFGDEQWTFITEIRGAVMNDPKSFFSTRNWRCITPSGGKNDSTLFNLTNQTTVDAFYVRPIACWVPHLLIANHVPTCPRCKSKDFVDLVKARWINSPKIMYGITSHLYLDTMLYPCTKCSGTFSGYHKQSLQLDANVVFGYFNYYLGHGYAVDEPLFRLIVESATSEATSTICRRLKTLQHTEYLDQYQLYLGAVGLDKVKPPKKKQKSIRALLPKATGDAELDRLIKVRNATMSNVSKCRMLYNSAHNKHAMDIKFVSILKDKDNHNVHGKSNCIPGLGSTKIRQLIQCEILSTKDLLVVDPIDYCASKLDHKIPKWQRMVESYYETLKIQRDLRKGEYNVAQAEHEKANEALIRYKNSDTARDIQQQVQRRLANPYRRIPGGNRAIEVPNEPSNPNWRPPLFSKFNDKQGYNGRVLSKYRVDSIVTSVFNHRKAFMEAKMMGLLACILKIDFNYKLASKLRVWTKAGQSFVPFKCIVTIQNEDGLTVFWKALKQSESFAEIEQDLIRLRHRLNRNFAATKSSNERQEQAVKVVYVDNCCSVCKVTKRCFPNALVKLDAFHWLKRWNEMLADCNSGQAGVFRALMSRALFTCGKDEFDHAKERLARKGKDNPSTKEIMKEANSVIPPPPLLRSNVEAVLSYCLAKDGEADRLIALHRDDDASPLPSKFFINSNVVKSIVRKQMKHVDKGCLSDPPNELVNIFRYNPIKKCCYIARGTNTNERDNLDLGHKILSATHIGIHRADRLMCTFFERKNQDKSIVRLGEEDYGTYDTERLLVLNSYALSVGYDKDLPFPKATAPTVAPTTPKEFMGFSYNLPEKLHRVRNPTDGTSIDDEMEEDGNSVGTEEEEEDREQELTEAQMDDMIGLLGEEFDVEIVVDEVEELVADALTEMELRQLQLAEEARRADAVVNKDFIQKELSRLVPNGDGRETTLKAFNRLTSDHSWIPFRMPDSSIRETDIDKAEADYFNEQDPSYSIAIKSGPKSYKNFAIAWNLEVSRRFKQWSQGEDDVQQLRLKSATQLEDYYKKKKQLQSLQHTATEEDQDRQLLNAQLKSTREQLPPRHEPHFVTPPTFIPQLHGITPFAHPTTLNAFITMAAVAAVRNNIAAPQRTSVAAPFRMTLPNLPKKTPARPTRKLFRSKMYCTACGWRKKEHTVDEGKGKRPSDCSRSFCGNCYQLKEYHHVTAGIPFGVNCTNPTNNYCSTNVNDWWEYKVC
jgi:Transposase